MRSFEHLVWALGHSLWQAALIAVLLWGTLSFCPTRWCRTRYAAALAALALVVFSAWFTWSLLERPGLWRSTLPFTASALEVFEKAPSPDGGVWTGGGGADAALTASAPLPFSWAICAGIAWLAGAACMLVRLGVGLGRVRWLVELGTPANLPLLGDLAARMRVRVRIRALVSDAYKVPAVVGAWWPILLVPAALLTEMSPAQLRMILAHELAHIRRWDYLINLVQQVLEALLFFNPAVWWISRQLRFEREACCDALAVATIGDAALLAETLTAVAGRMIGQPSLPLAALAATGEGGRRVWRRSGLVQRVQRLLGTGERAPLGFPAWTLATALFVSATVLAVIGSTAELTVRAAERLMTPAERVETITALQAAATRGADPGPARQIRGIIRTDNGDPLPAPPRGGLPLTVYTWGPGQSTIAGVQADALGRFSTTQKGHKAIAWAKLDGYAIAFSNEVELRPDIPTLEIILTRGFDGQLRIVDATGQGIPSARVELQYHIGDGASSSATVAMSDPAGAVRFPNAAARPAHITIEAPGFQQERRDLQLAPDATPALALARATPLNGRILDDASGLPIAGARLHLVRRHGYANRFFNPITSAPPLLATTDENGRFSLTTLRDRCDYTVLVSAPGHGSALLEGWRAGQPDFDVRLTPPRKVELFVEADPGQLPERISAEFTIVLKDSSYGDSIDLPVMPEEGRGRVVLDDPIPARVVFHAAGATARADVGKEPVQLTLDLREASRMRKAVTAREIIVRIDAPPGAPAPDGAFPYHATIAGTPRDSRWNTATVTNGEARFRIPAPGTLFIGQPKIPGYWAKQPAGLEVPLAADPLLITLTATPAGAVHGKVTGPDGKPWTRYFYARLLELDNTDLTLDQRSLIASSSDNVNNGTGAYLLSPLPLVGRYRVAATAGAMFALSEPFTLDPQHPVHALDLAFKPGIRLTGILRGPSGQPVPDVEVSLSWKGAINHSFATSVQTDEHGRFTFENVDPRAPGTYSLSIKAGETTRGLLLPKIQVSEQPVALTLKTGLALRGRLVEAASGKPIPNAKVTAMPTNWDRMEYPHPVETVTNAHGEFLFQNLEPDRFTIQCFSYSSEGATFTPTGPGQYASTPGKNWPTARAGSPDPIELRVVIPPWHQ